ncbi:MAG: TolC family protein [Opitutaceae bacterium]
MSPFHFFIPLALATAALGAEPAPFILREALAAALQKNPALRAQSFESRVAAARLAQAAVRPNPELSLSAENFLGTGALSGVKSLETTLQLSQAIDLGGSRARQIDAATSERALADADYEAKRLGVLAEVARRFTEAVADAERLAAAQRARALGEQTVAAVLTRVEAAVAPRTELNRARAALALLRLEEEHAEHELLVCRQSLAAAIGEPDPGFGPIRGDLLTLPAVPEFATLAARIESSPGLARFGPEARWREAQLRLAQSLRRTGLRVSGGLRRIEATDNFGFVAGLSLPLPARDQTAGAIREARERRAQLDVAAEAARLELRATLFAVYQEMLHARTALAALRDEVVPLAEETLALATASYRAGRSALTEILDAQKELLEFRRQIVAQAAAFHLHLVELERLLGAALS